MGGKKGKGGAGAAGGAAAASSSSSGSTGFLMQLLQTAAVTAALVLGALALGLVLTPHLLRQWEKHYGAADDAAARAAAVAGLPLEPTDIPPIDHLFKLGGVASEFGGARALEHGMREEERFSRERLLSRVCGWAWR